MSAAYTVDSVEGGIRSLNALISIIAEIRFNLAAGENDERADCLLWVARDVGEGLWEAFEHDLLVRAGKAVRK